MKNKMPLFYNSINRKQFNKIRNDGKECAINYKSSIHCKVKLCILNKRKAIFNT